MCVKGKVNNPNMCVDVNDMLVLLSGPGRARVGLEWDQSGTKVELKWD